MAKKEELSAKQIAFLKNYSDPKSETFGNAKRSALRVGYSETYANNITMLMPDWLSESIGRRKRMLEKAEMRLETLIDSEDERVAADVSKFIAKTQGKDAGYSERTEHTGKDGKDLIPDQAAKDKAAAAINEYLNDSPGITPG